MSQVLRNVIIIGAGGNLGPSVLSALDANPKLNVTVLSRASSKSKFPSHIRVTTSPDSYPSEELVAAFKGQDAIVDLAPLSNVPDHFKFIDAAIEAGVKRYIAGEFGSKTAEPRVNEAVPVFKAKVQVADYLRSKESTGLTWTGIVNGPFFDWGLQVGFLGFDLKAHKATIYDSGDAKTDVTLLSTVGKAVASVLEKSSETANKYVAINDFFVSQNEILAALEKASGKKWETTKASAAEASKIGKEKLLQHDYSGMVPAIIGLQFSGNEWVHHQGSDNGLLGLSQDEDLESVVAKIYEGAKA